MRKLYFLCVLTGAAVILDFVFLHSGSVYAQQSGLRIHRVSFGPNASTANAGQVFGRVVGFSCVSMGEGPAAECFVVTSPN